MSENVATKRWVQSYGYPLIGSICVVIVAVCWGLIRDSDAELAKHIEASDKIHTAIFNRIQQVSDQQIEIYRYMRVGIPSPALDEQMRMHPQLEIKP
jgi:hypothetical protein